MIKKTNRGETNLGSIAERLKEQASSLKPKQESAPVKKKEQVEKIPSVLSDDTPHIFVNGKLDKAKSRYSSKNIHVHQGLCDEMKKYCKGLDQAVFNYLIYLGLDRVKKAGSPMLVDIQEIEIKYL